MEETGNGSCLVHYQSPLMEIGTERGKVTRQNIFKGVGVLVLLKDSKIVGVGILFGGSSWQVGGVYVKECGCQH